MNILITGVSKGVGLEVVKLLLLEGHVIYGISRSRTESVVNLLSKYPNSFFYLQYDLTNVSNVPEMVFKKFINNKIPIHGYVNNAAIAYDDLITNLSNVQLEAMFSINTFTPMIMVKYILRNMIVNRIEGSIIHISSISVHTGYKGLAMYAATKGALEAFSKNTSREWGEKGIRSNCIVAGFMETSMSSILSDDQKNRIYKRTSLKQPTNINSVAETIAFLLSEKSKSITGQNIFVDNGTI